MEDIKGLVKTIHEYNKKYVITENSSEADCEDSGEKVHKRGILCNGKGSRGFYEI